MSNISMAGPKRRCSVCGEDDPAYLFRPPQSPGPVVSCKKCGFVYVNPIETTQALIQEGSVLGGRPAYLLESSNLDDIDGSWEQPIIEGYLHESPAKRVNAQDALRHIGNLTASHGRLLDIGCFCGLFLSVASQAGWECDGIEPLVMPAIYARGHFGLRVVTDTLRDDTYPQEFFDVVTCFQVFEHLINPDQEIQRIRRILKADGLLVIEVPNIDTCLVKLVGPRHRHFVQDHVSFFSAKTLTLLLNQMGFQVKGTYYPTRVISVQHLIWWMGKLGGSLFGKNLNHTLPRWFLEKHIRVSFRDIVTVLAKKV